MSILLILFLRAMQMRIIGSSTADFLILGATAIPADHNSLPSPFVLRAPSHIFLEDLSSVWNTP